MATSYTSNTKLGKPALADRNWNVPLSANIDLLDSLAPIGGLCVTAAEVPSASLNVCVAAGKYQKRDGTVGVFAAAASLTLAPSQTSWLYLTDGGVLTVSISGYPATSHVRLATVVTGPATVTGITDDRVVCSVVGTDALPFLPLAGGTLNEGANVALGTAAGTQIGTATTQKLGFWSATPVVRPSPYTQVYNLSTRTLAAYTSLVETTPFGGINNSQPASPYAQVNDLNTLRAAYENLRQLCENLAGLLNSVIDDLRSIGLLG
jgi:hypothetical protein